MPEQSSGPPGLEPEPVAVVAFTGTREAIDRFTQALSYAEAAIHSRIEDPNVDARASKVAQENDEWLMWGLGRISHQKVEQSRS